MVEHVEQDIYWDSRPAGEYLSSTYEWPTQRALRLGIPYIEHDGPLQSLTDDEEQPPDPWEPLQSMRPEDREWLDALGIISDRGSPVPAAAVTSGSGHEGRDGPKEDCDVQEQVTQKRTGAQKRKGEPEERDKLQEPAKRPRMDTRAATTKAATILRHKRKGIKGMTVSLRGRPRNRGRVNT